MIEETAGKASGEGGERVAPSVEAAGSGSSLPIAEQEERSITEGAPPQAERSAALERMAGQKLGSPEQAQRLTVELIRDAQERRAYAESRRDQLELELETLVNERRRLAAEASRDRQRLVAETACLRERCFHLHSDFGWHSIMSALAGIPCRVGGRHAQRYAQVGVRCGVSVALVPHLSHDRLHLVQGPRGRRPVGGARRSNAAAMVGAGFSD